MKKTGIVGCGAIFARHIESIEKNDDFSLVSICDVDERKIKRLSKIYEVPGYIDFKDMLQNEDLDFVVIATPNSDHFSQSLFCLQNGYDVLIEKPVSLNPEEVFTLEKVAAENNTRAYAVLQVRLNPVVQKVKKLLENNVIGQIRGMSLTQRWQRPHEYFTGWRAKPSIGGGTLHECGIHYMDIICYLFGKPEVHSSQVYNTKHKNVDVEDTVYSLLNFGEFGGTVEVTISCEPTNIECSMTILTDEGFIKLGGKALNEIIEAKFLNLETKEKYEQIVDGIKNSKKPNSYIQYEGSCPNHPELYSEIENFDISETKDAILLIDEIYGMSGIKYY